MISVKQTDFYKEVLKEINYSFADLFVFKYFVVFEINEGVVYTWENHAEKVLFDISEYLETDGADREIIYISNRINSYSVVVQDWIKFYKSKYKLKEFYLVNPTHKGKFNWVVESIFFKGKVKHFTSVEEAINVAKNKIIKVKEI